MRRVTFLLRIWVIAGAALLLLQTPKGDRGYAEYSPGSCINYATPTQTCPSGCTISSFTQYTLASGNGIYYLKVKSTTPCGSAKTGETCTNPTQYTNVWDFQDCCAQLGFDCTGVGYSYLNCCNAGAVCMSGTCCIPDTWSGCEKDSDCCSGGPCTNGTCQGSDCGVTGDDCDSQNPCCYPLLCTDGTCQSSGGGGGGGGGGDCCEDCPDIGGLCCDEETCECEPCDEIGASHSLGRTPMAKPPASPSANAPTGKVPLEKKAPTLPERHKSALASGPPSVGERK